MPEDKKAMAIEYLKVIIPVLMLIGAMMVGYSNLNAKIATAQVRVAGIEKTRPAAFRCAQQLPSLVIELTSLKQQVKTFPMVSAQTRRNTEDIKNLTLKIDQNRSILIELRTMMKIYYESDKKRRRR